MTTLKKIFLDEVDSTNGFAQVVARDHDSDEMVWISTRHQTQGKGQGNNQWITEPGSNITATLIYRPVEVCPARQFGISMAASLAVLGLVDLFCEFGSIKWPNDIYIGHQKCAGILIEHSVLGSRIKQSFIGVGLNVNQKEFPDSLPNPVSLKAITGIQFDVAELTDLLAEMLVSELGRLNHHSLPEYYDRYQKRLYRYKVFAPYKTEDEWMNARILGVDESGLLMLESENGKVRHFAHKEVEFIL